MTPEGIPEMNWDGEYGLKPWKDKIPKGLPEDFYNKCKAKGWIIPKSDVAFQMEDMDKTITDKAIRQDLLELLGKPIGMLSEKLRKLKTRDGKPVRYQMALTLSRYAPEPWNYTGISGKRWPNNKVGLISTWWMISLFPRRPIFPRMRAGVSAITHPSSATSWLTLSPMK